MYKYAVTPLLAVWLVGKWRQCLYYKL